MKFERIRKRAALEFWDETRLLKKLVGRIGEVGFQIGWGTAGLAVFGSFCLLGFQVLSWVWFGEWFSLNLRGLIYTLATFKLPECGLGIERPWRIAGLLSGGSLCGGRVVHGGEL